MTTRREFLASAGAASLTMAAEGLFAAADPKDPYTAASREIAQVKAAEYEQYLLGKGPAKAAFKRLDAAFDRVMAEVAATKVGPKENPAVWLLYNMGLVVKTNESLFGIDIRHRRELELAKILDFAFITHKHGDHWSKPYYELLNRRGKTVMSNFMENWGGNPGGYRRERGTVKLRDVTVNYDLCDHNEYLVNYTTAYELVFANGFRLYHTGDCCSERKLNPQQAPDLWCVHPMCGMDPRKGAKKFAPKRTAVLHLNEMGHDEWRWSYKNGLNAAKGIRTIGGCDAFVPVWGERIV